MDPELEQPGALITGECKATVIPPEEIETVSEEE